MFTNTVTLQKNLFAEQVNTCNPFRK